MNFKVYSLGCKVNSYECSALSSLLLSKGYQEAKGDDFGSYGLDRYTRAINNIKLI